MGKFLEKVKAAFKDEKGVEAARKRREYVKEKYDQYLGPEVRKQRQERRIASLKRQAEMAQQRARIAQAEAQVRKAKMSSYQGGLFGGPSMFGGTATKKSSPKKKKKKRKRKVYYEYR